MSIEEVQSIVIDTAKELGLLDSSDQLVPLDSLMTLDLIIALEANMKLQIPVTKLHAETFVSVASVSQMLTELRRAMEASSPGSPL